MTPGSEFVAVMVQKGAGHKIFSPVAQKRYTCPKSLPEVRQAHYLTSAREKTLMPKGQEKPKTINKPKLSTKEKKQKKKDKAAAKGSS